MPYAVILNSRQSKTPLGDDPWILATRKAVDHAVGRGLTIIGSVGLSTWELVTWLGSASGGSTLVIIPYPYQANLGLPEITADSGSAEIAASIRREFALEIGMSDFIFQPTAKRGAKRKSAWIDRDRTALQMADVVYPVSIKPGGTLEGMIGNECGSKEICEQFSTAYRQRKNPRRFHPKEEFVSLSHFAEPHLVHWTRTVVGKWPGETAAEYYRAVIDSGPTYARSSLATLGQILREKRIRATARHIRGGHQVISFTSLPPGEAVKLMRWRRRYVRMNLEPYGIAVRQDFARTLGARSVIYGSPPDYEILSPDDQPFFQNRGEKGGDWQPEREWRISGDVDLALIPPEALKIIVRSPEEIPQVPALMQSMVIPLFAPHR